LLGVSKTLSNPLFLIRVYTKQDIKDDIKDIKEDIKVIFSCWVYIKRNSYNLKDMSSDISWDDWESGQTITSQLLYEIIENNYIYNNMIAIVLTLS